MMKRLTWQTRQMWQYRNLSNNMNKNQLTDCSLGVGRSPAIASETPRTSFSNANCAAWSAALSVPPRA